jgi:hypothetical protein
VGGGPGREIQISTRGYDLNIITTIRKATKYGSIAKVVPFIVSPFGVLSRPAKAFLKRAMGDTTTAKQAKARLRLAVAAVRGTARLSYAWGACAALIVGN